MVTIVDDLDSLTLQEAIFKDVRYYISGDVSEKIMQLLQSGGAENTKYFSDYVTHLICGRNAADTDLEEALDIYQIPAVTEHWVAACARLKKLANTKSYSPNRNKIFTNLVACVAKVSSTDAKALFALITYHGGRVKLSLDSQCTHLICGLASGNKYRAALSLPPSKIKIVTPDWVLESVRARIQAVTEIFHPKLLIVPQPVTKSMEPRISAITGFDFEEGIAKNEVPTQNMSEKDDTQALLNKLKQRMPWNHPPSTANSSAPPTSAVATMGYTSAVTPNIMNKSLPQGIVTQSMQIQSSQAQQMMQKFGQNTIVSSQSGMSLQSQQPTYQAQQQQQQQQLQQQQQQLQQSQQQSQQQPHGLTAIQIQQQKLLQQHQQQIRMQMLQQQNKNVNQQQQGFAQQSVSVSSINQNMPGQLQQHMQSNQHHVQHQQSMSQTPTSMSTSAQQQIENISQMLSQSANNLQQQQLNQQNMVMKQGLSLSQQTASQAVQNIAQQLAQSTQNLQQSLQNAKMNQGMGQSQVIGQQQMISSTSQQQSLIQQQNVQSMGNQQQNINMGVVNQQGMVSTSQAQVGPGVVQQLNQLAGSPGQQTAIGQQIQQNIQQQQNSNVQGAWRQQNNIQMVQNINQVQHQIIRSPLVQPRNPQSQVIMQQQLYNQQAQSNPQHAIQQPQQILQQTQGQTHHQILVSKQLLSGSGQQQIVQGGQQVLLNQHPGQQQILLHGNQQVTLQGNQQIVSQSQIVHQTGQLVNQSGQIIAQGTQQVLSQGGQHVITQQGAQSQVVIAQPSQQIVTQSNQQILGQSQGQQVGGQAQLSSGNIQQIITHGGQQIVSPGGQLVQGQNVSWQQQQQYLQQRQQIGQPGAVGPRVSWTAGGGGRQLIHLDAQTHATLQQMDPQQRAMFVAQLQKRRQLMQRHAIAQQQQPGVPVSPGAPAAGAQQSVTFIRSPLPPGLSQQQQVQWLQQQGARAATIPAASPAQPPQSPG